MAMKRYRVAGHSMTPALAPGQELVASFTRAPEPGNVVVFEHPAQPDFWLIKRLVDDSGWVLSDNLEHGDTDSRTLGIIDPARMGTVVDHLDVATFEEACHLLATEDEHLAAIVERWGLPGFWARSPGFATLVLLICEQQVSLESGAAMFRRLQGLVGPVTPEAILAAGEPGLRSIGVTRQKTAYLIELAGRVVGGSLDLDALGDLPVDEARAVLLSLHGVGPWTADAYLLSALRRPDSWPVGDRALQVGVAETLQMASIPKPDELELIGEPWRPLRAAAARLIWHGYLSRRGRVEPPDPTLAHPAGEEA
jgi:DNA-3-methyladenine glycosylase II